MTECNKSVFLASQSIDMIDAVKWLEEMAEQLKEMEDK